MLKLPSWASVSLGLVAGAAAVLNELAFSFTAEWRSFISVGLIFLAGLGIAPLVGSSFRAALHLSQTTSLFLTSALGALALGIHTLNISEGVRGILQGILTFAAAVGFAPTTPEAERKVVRR
jgi:hypothetical protein